jgi:hypothetical protein
MPRHAGHRDTVTCGHISNQASWRLEAWHIVFYKPENSLFLFAKHGSLVCV